MCEVSSFMNPTNDGGSNVHFYLQCVPAPIYRVTTKNTATLLYSVLINKVNYDRSSYCLFIPSILYLTKFIVDLPLQLLSVIIFFYNQDDV